MNDNRISDFGKHFVLIVLVLVLVLVLLCHFLLFSTCLRCDIKLENSMPRSFEAGAFRTFFVNWVCAVLIVMGIMYLGVLRL